MASIKSIVEMRESMERNDGGRNASYDEAVQFYTGSDLKSTKKQGFISGITNALSSIFTPRAEDEDLEILTPLNVVKPAIDNKVAFLSLVPSVRIIEPPDSLAPVGGASPEMQAGTPPEMPMGLSPEMPQMPPEMSQMPPGMPHEEQSLPNSPPGVPAEPAEVKNEDWAASFSDREEKVVNTLLDASNITRRARDVAWSIATMGGAVIGVWPDLRNGRPRIFTRTPQYFYPVAYDDDGLELQKALWVDTMTGLEVAAQYDVKDYVDEDEVDVTFYMDEESFCTILNNEKWAHPPITNTLGIVPIVCIGSMGVPGMIFGTTDFKDAIPVAKQINYHMALLDKIANATIEPTIFITDPLEVPDDLAIGKGGVATAGKDGSVELLGPIQLPPAFWTLGEVLNNWFDLIADNPAVLRAQGQGSIITGKGFNAQLGPVAARLQTKLDLIMSGWKRVIKYMLIMWANFEGANKPQKGTGVKNKEYYYIEAEPSEFILNGEIWTELECSVNAQSYIDKQGDRIGLIQLYQAELLDWDTVAGQLDEIVDRGRVRRNIDKDRQWKARGMALAQQLAVSPATANAQVGEVETSNYAMERGQLSEAPPPPVPTAEMPTEQPTEQGMEVAPSPQGLLDILGEFFDGIGKLRGSAWWGGEPIRNPRAFDNPDWKVTVWITDGQDQGTITRAAAKIPEIYGHIKFIQGQPGPEENAVQFSQGEEAPPPVGPTGDEELDQAISSVV